MSALPRSPYLHRLLSRGKLLRVKKNEVFSSTAEGGEIMMVIKGYVKRYSITTQGSLGIQIVYGPQDVFSLTRVYSLLLEQSIYDGPETFYYQAISDAQLYIIDGPTFAKAVQNNPFLYRELFSEAGQHLKSCVHRIENMSLVDAYARVAHELLYCVRELGVPTTKGVKIALPLTHQAIADILGTSRETVTRALIRLNKEGLIGAGRNISILDVKGLEKAAYH